MKINAVTFLNNVFTDVKSFSLADVFIKPQSVLVINLSLQKGCRF